MGDRLEKVVVVAVVVLRLARQRAGVSSSARRWVWTRQECGLFRWTQVQRLDGIGSR